MSKVGLITLDLFFSGGQYSEETINITVCFSDPTIEFLTFNYFLMDAEGQRVDCGKQEILSDQFKKETTFALPLSKTKIMQNKEQYLVKDALLLRCEYSFSTGDILEGIERIDFGNVSSKTQNVIIEKQTAFNTERKLIKHSISLSEDFKKLYENPTLSDVELRTKTKKFHVHSAVLCARSTVFNSKIGNDMKDKLNKCLEVCDVDTDTLRE
ncbi:TD and POZ domain-containing protein 4 [Caerostris darwini]|uniref:TD and POZ domain-containing protein 4 n=1 Tax=Caerostris darwini TaxID=1538125 RepID=A0AAV4SKY9_9ARAC|nr:TD and POZ domain-containing protein 4 [Caerostris darwini]